MEISRRIEGGLRRIYPAQCDEPLRVKADGFPHPGSVMCHFGLRRITEIILRRFLYAYHRFKSFTPENVDYCARLGVAIDIHVM